MDIKPNKEKKKKKVSKKRAQEINRRRESVLTHIDSENLLIPSPAHFVTHSAPGSRRGSLTEASDKDITKESEEDLVDNGTRNVLPHSDTEDDGGMSDLWKHTLPIAIVESAWKHKTRRASTRRRSSEVSESDAKAVLDRLRMEKAVNVMKKKNVENPKFFWDDVKTIDEQGTEMLDATPEPI